MRSAVGILALLCCASLAAAQQNPLVKNVEGVIVGPPGRTGRFRGLLTITGAKRVDNVLRMTAKITQGKILEDGKPDLEVPEFTLPGPAPGAPGRKLLQPGGVLDALLVNSITGSCEILDLQIGRIQLDLLGLVVDLAPIDLNITAQSGPGNLLGNLLCAVANLLNGGLNLNALVLQLNRLINNLLGGLGR